MLKYSRTLRDRLAIIGVAGAFAVSPLVISPVMAQTLGAESDDTYRIIESDPNTLQPEGTEEAQQSVHPEDTMVEENQVEPYSDKMAAEEPAPTEGDPIASDDQVPVDSDALSAHDQDLSDDSFAAEENATSDDSFAADDDAASGDSVASDPAANTTDGVDPMTSAAIPEDGGDTGSLYVLEQGDDQVMANNYIGKSVYNDAMEKVGDIRDLVFTKDGGLEAAVIGVGGFLGLGQKQVAVRFDEIRIQENPETAELELYISANEEQLAEAPEFTTKEDRLAQSRTQDAGSEPDGTIDPMAPAPME